ncbi:MAG: hypothetical protein HUU46_19155 [Candidatus Hydrogenedentes bacterium]|nr:hypothetical protein [Candidatus Hydrogenedentota bacterium]
MRVIFSPPKARIVAVVIGAWMVWTLIERHSITGLRLPPFEPVHVIAAMCVIGITIVGILRLLIDRNSPWQ